MPWQHFISQCSLMNINMTASVVLLFSEFCSLCSYICACAYGAARSDKQLLVRGKGNQEKFKIAVDDWKEYHDSLADPDPKKSSQICRRLC